MVTVETALALTALAVVTVGMAWVVSVVGAQARCVDAARDTARAVARGETLSASRAEGMRSAPEGSRIAIQVEDGLATVRVRVAARPPWQVLSGVPGIEVTGQAAVVLEPGSP